MKKLFCYGACTGALALGYIAPASARYISADPMGLQGGPNLYAYVDGNPLTYADPMGLLKIIRVPKDDPAYPAALKVPDDPAICLIISHGSNQTVNHMNAVQLNDLLKKNGCQPKQPVKIQACRAGEGENSIAEQLAKIRQGEVVAPDNRVWSYGETTYNTPAPPVSENHDSWWNNVPNWLSPGAWRTFGPDGPKK